MTGTGVPLAQYEKEEGSFRVNFSFPITNDTLNGPILGKTSAITVPFILPPFQEAFGGNKNDAAGYDLVEVAVSQDTRAEAGQIKPITTGGTFVGNPVLGTAVAFDLSIKSHAIDESTYDNFGTEVFSFSMPEIALLNPYARMNPHVQSGISIPLSSSNSYLVHVTPKGSAATGDCIVSLFISLKFKTKLTTRDIGTAAQNQTPLSARNFTLQSASIPAANTTIEADTVDGVNTGFKLIDAFIDRRFRGGYNRAGLSQYKEGLADDACYDIISIPMFGSWPHVGGGPALSAALLARGNDLPFSSLPWSSTLAGQFATVDRALIPIQHPLSIHHVIVACNYTGGSGEETLRPSVANAPNLLHEVGVGLMSGHAADNVGHEQVAFVNWTPATIGTNLIDRGDHSHSDTTGKSAGYSWDIINCPLVGAATAPGSGYSAQGKPIFAAAGNTATVARSNVGGAPPALGGGEQVLDIRWKISNGAVSPATWANRESIIGYGGHWIYLICKKTVI
tara:strand:+ start:18136 stop:19659 length:1524 start_codon:yes stop_codon:yes gene_type:complete